MQQALPDALRARSRLRRLHVQVAEDLISLALTLCSINIGAHIQDRAHTYTRLLETQRQEAPHFHARDCEL